MNNRIGHTTAVFRALYLIDTAEGHLMILMRYFAVYLYFSECSVYGGMHTDFSIDRNDFGHINSGAFLVAFNIN